MNAKDIEKRVLACKKAIEDEVKRVLPRKVGIIATNHFKQNFRDGGFRDGGLHRWKRTHRQNDPNNPDSEYGALLSRRNHLMSSTTFVAGYGEVTITNSVPYAALHNEGGTLTMQPTITPAMRKFAWAKTYSLAGVCGGSLPKELPPEAARWRALALTKKTQLNITAHVPKRQFIGESAELNKKIEKEINNSLDKIKDGITRL